MKKNGIVLILIFSINYVFAQNKNGTIKYKKEIIEFLSEKEDFKINKEKNPKYYNTVLMIEQNTKKLLNEIQFSLRFNNSESLFEADGYMEIEENRFYRVAIGPEGSSIYYTNEKENVNLRQVDTYGELFIIAYPKTEWQLTNETKKIDNYMCYKATTTKLVNGRKGLIKIPVEVWYAPEINIPYGPLGYNGLPGLIMELTLGNFKYNVAKIELNPKNEIKIDKPTKGKEVTKDEFEKIGISALESFKKGF